MKTITISLISVGIGLLFSLMWYLVGSNVIVMNATILAIIFYFGMIIMERLDEV